MGLLSNLFTRSTEGDCKDDYRQAFLRGDDMGVYGTSTAAGPYVDESNAMTLTAVYACVGIKARSIAMLPLDIIKRTGKKGKEKAYRHPLYNLLKYNPNPLQTAYKWREMMLTQCYLWGGAMSIKEYDRSGNVKALWPVPSWRVTPMITKDEKGIYYQVDMGAGKKINIPSFDVVCFTTLSTSVYKWISPIALHRETLGAAMAVKEFGARTFGQGINPAGIVTLPEIGDEDNERDIKEEFKKYTGLGRSHKLMFLEEGMKFERVGIPPKDSQFLETRRFDVSEVARMYNVPLFMLADHEKQTSWGTGLEEQKSGFVTFTLQPDTTQIEQEIHKKLLYNDEKYFPSFNFNVLTKGKLIDRYDAYVKGINNGILMPNEARAKENMNPVEDGDELFVPMNMQKLSSAGADNNQQAPNNSGGNNE